MSMGHETILKFQTFFVQLACSSVVLVGKASFFSYFQLNFILNGNSTIHKTRQKHIRNCQSWPNTCGWRAIESITFSTHQLEFAIFYRALWNYDYCVRARPTNKQRSFSFALALFRTLDTFIFVCNVRFEHQYRRFIFITQWIINANKSNKFICWQYKRKEKINNESPHSLNFGLWIARYLLTRSEIS